MYFCNLYGIIIFQVVGTVKDDAGEEQSLSNAKVMCRLCFGGENEGSERARKMLPCNSCGKKYHRGCLKSWAQHRGGTNFFQNMPI